jgi:ribosome biogenesis GTPase
MKSGRGQVLAVQANFYRVLLAETGQTILCTRRALLKKMGQAVCVGDRVRVEEIYGDRGVITFVDDRVNYISRPAMANLEQIILVCALAEPAPDPWQISRFLVHCQMTGVPVVVGLSKADLVAKHEQTQWLDRLQSWGYRALAFSTATGGRDEGTAGGVLPWGDYPSYGAIGGR